MEKLKHLKNYIAGKFPLIAINSSEPIRILDYLNEIINELNKKAEKHTSIRNYFRLDIYDNSVYDINSFLKASKFKIKNSFNGHIVKVIPECHLFLGTKLIPEIRRIYQNDMKQSIVCIGNIHELPEEILQYFIYLDFPLPTREEIEAFLKSLSSVLKRPLTNISELSTIAVGMTLAEIENAIRYSNFYSSKQDIKNLYDAKKHKLLKSQLLIPEKTVDIKMVGGLGKLKKSFEFLQKFAHNQQKAIEFGLSVPKGCLLTGIPGTGKTLVAKALANYLNLPLYRCDIGRLLNSYIGETESRTRKLLKLFDSISPCVILFDEIEKQLINVNLNSENDTGVISRLIASLLYYMEDKDTFTYFVATANRIESLPPELLRKGRWDNIWFIDLPAPEERHSIFKIHFEKNGRKLSDYISDMSEIIDKTKNFTGAEIESVVQQSLRKAFCKDRDVIIDDILTSIKNTRPISIIKKDEISELREWAKDKAIKANTE